MHKRHLLFAAVCSAIWCGSAQAQQTITTAAKTFYCDDPACIAADATAALGAFDPSLGTLTGISIRIDDVTQSGYMGVELFPPFTSTAVLSSSATFVAKVNGIEYSVPITAQPETVSLLAPFTLEGSGSATFNIDASLFSSFIGRADQCGTQTGICVTDNVDLWLYPAGLPAGDVAGGSGSGSTTTYTLTYAYTPFGAAVPEPSPWAMMLLGFGGIGITLRMRRRRAGLGQSA